MYLVEVCLLLGLYLLLFCLFCFLHFEFECEVVFAVDEAGLTTVFHECFENVVGALGNV